jgi:hypothetical protein
MKRFVLALFALLLALLPTPARAQPAPLVIASGEVVEGDVATLDQPILVQGLVVGDVTSWSGSITIKGEVRGDVVSYAGSIELAEGARVGGNVLAMAGGVGRAAQASVAGQLLGDGPVAGGAMIASIATIFGQPTGQRSAQIPRPLVSGAMALLALLSCALFAALWPRRTAGAANALRHAPLHATGIGLLTTLLAAILLPPLASLLALSLVGLPFLLPLLLALQLPYLFGLTAIGRLLADALGWRDPRATLGAILACLLLLLPLAYIGVTAPLASAALFYLVSGVGLGAAILSRGGAYALRPG